MNCRVVTVRVFVSVLNVAKTLLRKSEGNITTSFALTLIPLMTMVGISLDLSRVEGSARQVQYALDSAVLAASRELQDDAKDKDIEKKAQNYFNASLQANSVNATCGAVSLKIDRTEFHIDSSVTCEQKTTLSGLVGMNKLTFTRDSETRYGVGKLDVVFMFDTSGSMGEQGRMGDLQTAAKEAVKTILKSKVKKKGDVRIAISTYATSVNVGEEYFEAVTDFPPNEYTCTKWKKKKKKWTCENWKQLSATCVTGREGTHKYTSAPPGAGAWIAYDTTSCNSATLTPLTDIQGRLISAIETLPTSGSTAGHLGIAWSWYLLDPDWSTIWTGDAAPKPYDEPDLTKVAILMTDGEFNVDYMSNGDSFAHAKKFCDGMKAKGIQIYTVAFKAPKDGQEILKYCATTEGQYYSASSGDELSDAYKKIATSVSDLRISH